MTVLVIIGVYLGALLLLGLLSGRAYKGTSQDWFIASRSIGPFLLLMSLFGTTMTAFALVGSTGAAYVDGVGVYGLMASWSGLIHSAVFFLVGTRIWALGRRHGFVTQTQFFRDRFDSQALGYLLFPILVVLIVPYLLIGLLGAGQTVAGVTRAALPHAFLGPDGAPGGIPPWLTSAIIAAVVYAYVFFGGLRAAVWANAFQTLVFIVVGLLAFYAIADSLGGMNAAITKADPSRLVRTGHVTQLEFASYCLVPLSVGMFPHIFQHWLTARSARTFRLAVIAHPILIMLVWVPCILIGVWATGVLDFPPQKANAVLGAMVARFTTPWMSGLVTAGILAAIMSSLDSQFLCLGTMFTHDVVLRGERAARVPDARKVLYARVFVGLVVLATWALSLVVTRGIFALGVFCFSGFAGLFPLVFAAIYWRRATLWGAVASVLAGGAVWTALFVRFLGMPPGAAEPLIFGVMPVVPIVLASTAALIIVSLCTRPPAEATLTRFFPPARTAR
ncbi:MAG: sodium:solute symporter family protein [Deltaproteobacteria bacterium]|nr:sodium:solute symporter family protein [Deltaproteobacteria bacterium]